MDTEKIELKIALRGAIELLQDKEVPKGLREILIEDYKKLVE